MKRFSRIAKYIFPLLFLSTCFSVGFGSWSLRSERSYANVEIGKQTKDPVAYIKNSNGNTYYMTLEKAIEVANRASTVTDVWVIPGTTYTLEAKELTTITIKSNVTLQLPFQDEIVFDVFKGSNGSYDPKGSQSVSSTNALDNPSTYRKTQITLSSNVILENYGTINIGGVIGSEGGGKGPCGQTCSYYCEIVCSKVNDGNENSAQITNYGTIKNQGSITTTSDDAIGIENVSGSTMKTVLVIGENRGGSALIKLGTVHVDLRLNKTITFDCSPFNTVYMPNISANTKCDSGSTVMGLGNMYGGSSHNPVEVPIYGNADNYLIQSTGGYVVSRYVRNDSKQFQDIDLFGDHSINYMKMPISISYGEISLDATIITEGVLFPLSYLNDLSFNSIDGKQTNITCSQDIKVMPGGKLTVGESTTLNIGQLAIYNSSFRDPLTDGVTYPVLKENGILELSGSIKAKNFGGYASIKKENASLNITGSVSVSSKQIIGNPANTQYEDFLFNASSTVSSNGGGDLFSGTLVDAKEYSSLSTNSGEFYFAVNEVKHSVKIHCCGKFNREIKNWLGIVKSYEYVYPTYDFIGPDGSKISSASQNSSTITTDTDTKKTMIPYNFHVILKHGDTIKISNLKNGTMSANVAFNDNSFIVDEDIYIVINYKN